MSPGVFRLLLSFLLLSVLCPSCKDSDGTYDNLREYIDLNSDWTRKTELIACAAGGGQFSMDNPQAPISIFFYPQTTGFDFKYFETDNADVNKLDLSKYKERELEVSDVFNGYLRKFARGHSSRDRWAIVSYRLDGRMWTCQPILLKSVDAPTLVDNEAVKFLNTDTTNPTFTWNDNSTSENDIYFQVVSDLDGNLISGTYTFDTDFDFYAPEEFAPNITDPLSNPILESGKSYNFTLMGVDEDNWVNLISQKVFTID